MMKTNKHQKTFGLICLAIILVLGVFLGTPQKAKAVVPVLDSCVCKSTAALLIEFTEYNVAWSAWALDDFILDQFIAASTGAIGAKEIGKANASAFHWLGIEAAALDAAASADPSCSAGSWDCFVQRIVRIIVHEFFDSLRDWIKNGLTQCLDSAKSGGDCEAPVFIKDYKSFLKSAAVNASGVFIEEYGLADYMCGSWSLPVLSALVEIQTNVDVTHPRYPDCTLPEAIDNIADMWTYLTDFREGGWGLWWDFTSDPANNAVGVYMEARHQMLSQESAASQEADTESTAGQGFISLKTCANEVNGFCKEWKINSPGKWVENQIAWSSTSEIRSMEIADEIDETVTVLMQVMVSWIFEGLL